MADGEYGFSGRLRKRRRQAAGVEERMNQLLEVTSDSKRIILFTGSGLSATSGMSMFSTKNGLYERARKKFRIQDGIRLFSYSFYKQRRADVQAFFAQIYSEAQASKAAQGHYAVAQLQDLGVLQRHYTMNIDGLAEVVGMDTWHPDFNPQGITVEMHGNIRNVVCPQCHGIEPLSRAMINTMKQHKPVNCGNCQEGEMRFKVMLYDDEEGDCITPEDVWDVLEEDLAVADAVLWLGISFEQSASTEYFRKVRHMLSSSGRLAQVHQVVINPSEDAMFNLMSSCANKEDIKVLEVLGGSDDVLPQLVQHLQKGPGGKPLATTPAAAAGAMGVEGSAVAVAGGRGRGRGRGKSSSREATPDVATVGAVAAGAAAGAAAAVLCAAVKLHPATMSALQTTDGGDDRGNPVGHSSRSASPADAAAAALESALAAAEGNGCRVALRAVAAAAMAGAPAGMAAAVVRAAATSLVWSETPASAQGRSATPVSARGSAFGKGSLETLHPGDGGFGGSSAEPMGEVGTSAPAACDAGIRGVTAAAVSVAGSSAGSSERCGCDAVAASTSGMQHAAPPGGAVAGLAADARGLVGMVDAVEQQQQYQAACPACSLGQCRCRLGSPIRA